MPEIFVIIELISSVTILTRTMPAPVGRLKRKEISIPHMKQKIEKNAERVTRYLKLRTNFLAIMAGKIIKLEIKSVPIILMPMTTVSAVRKEIKNW